MEISKDKQQRLNKKLEIVRAHDAKELETLQSLEAS